MLAPQRTEEAKFQAVGFTAEAVDYCLIFGPRQGNLIQCFLSYGQLFSLGWLGGGWRMFKSQNRPVGRNWKCHIVEYADDIDWVKPASLDRIVRLSGPRLFV